MLLLKGFLRNSKTKIYIAIFIVLCVVLFVLNSFDNYYKRLYDNHRNEHAAFVMFTTHDYESMLKNEKLVKSFYRAFNFNPGKNNDIITSSEGSTNGSTIIYENTDLTKLLWDGLIYYKNILALPDSMIDENLEEDEVILATSEFFYKNDILDKVIGKKIEFNYDNKAIEFTVRDIIMPNSYSCIYIADSLYNKLNYIENEYTYVIQGESFHDLDLLSDKWYNLETDKSYRLGFGTSFVNEEDTHKASYLYDLITMIHIANIISTIIFFIIFFVTIKDIVSSQYKSCLLLKQIGFQRSQINKISLQNICILDGIVLLFSVVISAIVIFILNKMFNFSLDLFNLNNYILVSLFIIFVEIIEIYTLRLKFNK